MTQYKRSAEKEALYRLKFEIAQELGLGDKVREGGFGSLTTAESGRIGGILAARRKNA